MRLQEGGDVVILTAGVGIFGVVAGGGQPFEGGRADLGQRLGGVALADRALGARGERVLDREVDRGVDQILEVGARITAGLRRRRVDVEVGRDTIESPTVTTQALGEDGEIGYIRLYVFNENASTLLEQAVEVADLFIKDGLIVYTKGREADAQMEFSAKSSGTRWKTGFSRSHWSQVPIVPQPAR